MPNKILLLGAALFSLGVFLIPTHSALAGSYTYSRTLDSSALNQYSYELQILDTSQTPACYVIAERTYPTAADCTAAENTQPPSGATILDSCTQLTQLNYSYTRDNPICDATISALGFTLTNQQANTATANPASTGGTNTCSGSSGTGILSNPLQACDLATLLVEVLGYVVKIGAIFLVLMIVLVGFQFVMAQGNPEAVQKARSSLLWTAVGGILLLGAQAIASVIAATVQSL